VFAEPATTLPTAGSIDWHDVDRSRPAVGWVAVARIVEFFELGSSGHFQPHKTEVQCGHTIVETESGRLLQLSTYGSSNRQTGGVSQTIQLDESAAQEVVRLIKVAFPRL
jgi:hypothetical protein